MFDISFTQYQGLDASICTISNKKGTKAVIHTQLGASLQQLFFNDKAIINNIIEQDGQQQYLNSSCSAVLFPFANRINKGRFSYQQKDYQLHCNETARGHAMHGLVYQNPFEIAQISNSEGKATLAFSQQYDGKDKGFPFPFKITLIYTLTETKLKLEVKVQNTGTSSFPFSLGWHPYFYSSNLEKSSLYMESTEEIIANEGMIPITKAPYNFPNPLALKDQEFDNGFLLKSSTIAYQTPDYKINLRTEQDNSSQYIQLYIPSHRQSIAIEPMTAAADCFNNHLGTKELLPKESYSIAWIVENFFLPSTNTN